ncbi:MAG: hypothetical protein Q8P68_05115 [Candidatus Peregrinibacteria bacterium]|nr:hypothetical protein [Candidatus Peregrinibacteria bacterium]MDZ4244468.1 hypothetical protein [Candidatus Gracilibacteria bacterium]
MPKIQKTQISKTIINLILFICGIILIVGISSFIAFGATPTTETPNFKSLVIGRAGLDNIGMTIFGDNFSFDFWGLNYMDSLSPTGSLYAVSINSNKAGTIVTGKNVGVLGENKQNAANKYGRTGVIGQVITPSQGVGRGILGYLEPIASISSPPPDPNAIPKYTPIDTGNLYGIYADAAESHLANVTIDGRITSTVTSTDGTTEFEGPVDFLGSLTVEDTLTVDKFVLDANLYENAQITTSAATNFLQNNLNKMIFTVRNSTPVLTTSAPGLTQATATCPNGSVRISCYGDVTSTVEISPEYLGFSSFRGTSTNDNNGCKSYAQNKGEGYVHAAAMCMVPQLP